VRHLSLVEYQTAEGVSLSREERDALQRLLPGLAISPSIGSDSRYDLTPGSWVGAIGLGSLAVEIRPKLPIGNVLFLLAYSLDPRAWRDGPFDFRAHTLSEAVLPAFLHQVALATRRGLLYGYRPREEALETVRGALRFGDQVRYHHGRQLPVEVRYDEFTADVDENRLLKAALHALRGLPSRRAATSRLWWRTAALFADVSSVSYHPSQLPDVRYTPLNVHYRPAVELAKLIVRATAFDLGHGAVRASAFLLDMNQVFEDFVVIALREALALPEHAFPQGLRWTASDGRRHTRRLPLDRAGAVRLQPDLSWWEGGTCAFVGDVKYKRTGAGGVEHPDLYQLLAYTVAAGLPGGLLVYAAGEESDDGTDDGSPISHDVVRAGKQLQVTTLDLAGSPEQILAQIRVLAERVRRLRHRAAG
jgi:5-methylcytosine-specific restriction enzyme subunit McrC